MICNNVRTQSDNQCSIMTQEHWYRALPIMICNNVRTHSDNQCSVVTHEHWYRALPIMICTMSEHTNTKYKYNSYFYCTPYSLTDGALQKSANTCFTVVGRLK